MGKAAVDRQRDVEYLGDGIYVERDGQRVTVSAQIWGEDRYLRLTEVVIDREGKGDVEIVNPEEEDAAKRKYRMVRLSRPRLASLGYPDLSWSAEQLRTCAKLLTVVATAMDGMPAERIVEGKLG